MEDKHFLRSTIVQEKRNCIVKGVIKLGCTALIMLFLCTGCAIISHYGAYHGKVVDAETKEPLEGAAVLAVYFTTSSGPGGAISHYLDAQETVTDKNGEFRIPPLTVTTFRVLQGFDAHPQFTIFKPGYGAYPKHKDVKPTFPYWSLPSNQYVTIELPKLGTNQERKENLCGRNLDAPLEKQKHLIKLLNQERKYLGYESFYQED